MALFNVLDEGRISPYPSQAPKKLNRRYCRHKTHVNSDKRCAAKTPALGGDRTSWPSDLRSL